MTRLETPAEYEASADAKQSDHESQAFERSDAAKVAAVAALAESWRYDGKYGWGPWQAGEGPDIEGQVLDECASAIRTALADPDAALARVRAEAWDEGKNAGATDSAVIIGWGVKGADPAESPALTPNPYRAASS